MYQALRENVVLGHGCSLCQVYAVAKTSAILLPLDFKPNPSIVLCNTARFARAGENGARSRQPSYMYASAQPLHAR